MGKKLAIKGHPTRGKEVIELLEMLGGNNSLSDTGLRLNGTEYCCVYYIGTAGSIIYSHHSIINDDFIVFTLEEFWEKYPFKVGDKVVYTKFGENCYDFPEIIESMKWTGTTIEYTFNDYVTCLAKDLKMWNGESDTVISGIYLNSCNYADEVELNLGDYEIEVRDGKTYAVKKKPKYPDNYDECVRIAKNIHGYDIHIDTPAYRELMESFVKLLICRDAYLKIAGEQMGLDKPWGPDWDDRNQPKYGIHNVQNNIRTIALYVLKNMVLVFPTEEMRDIFYENFKDLIEQCKELL